MPVYDYTCECGLSISRFYSMKEYKKRIKCPQCEKMMKIDITSNIKSQANVLPPHMRTNRGGTAGDNDLKWDKSPSKRKHFW